MKQSWTLQEPGIFPFHCMRAFWCQLLCLFACLFARLFVCLLIACLFVCLFVCLFFVQENAREQNGMTEERDERQ